MESFLYSFPPEGEGDEFSFGMCSRIHPDVEFMSMNNIAYWIELDYINVEMRIAKDHPYGKKITLLLERLTGKDLRQAIWANGHKMLLNHLEVTHFQEILKERFRRGQMEGRNKLRSELKGLFNEEFRELSGRSHRVLVGKTTKK